MRWAELGEGWYRAIPKDGVAHPFPDFQGSRLLLDNTPGEGGAICTSEQFAAFVVGPGHVYPGGVLMSWGKDLGSIDDFFDFEESEAGKEPQPSIEGMVRAVETVLGCGPSPSAATLARLAGKEG